MSEEALFDERRRGFDVMRFHLEQSDRVARIRLPAFGKDLELDAIARNASADGKAGNRDNENAYALQPDSLAVLAGTLESIRPQSIVEFGSGASTKLFAKWSVTHGASVVSVEHDRGWIADVTRQLDPHERGVVTVVHRPLRPKQVGPRQFLTYQRLTDMTQAVQRADLFLLDGPHMSGRELVLYFVLGNCRPGAVIAIDDLRHYAVLEMLAGLPDRAVGCFTGTAVEDNSHGLLLLRCRTTPGPIALPAGSIRSILQSYWRCVRDFRQYGTGG